MTALKARFVELATIKPDELGDWLDANLGGKWWRVTFLLCYVMVVASAVFSVGPWYNRAGNVFLVIIGTHALTQFGVWGRRRPGAE